MRVPYPNPWHRLLAKPAFWAALLILAAGFAASRTF